MSALYATSGINWLTVYDAVLPYGNALLFFTFSLQEINNIMF